MVYAVRFTNGCVNISCKQAHAEMTVSANRGVTPAVEITFTHPYNIYMCYLSSSKYRKGNRARNLIVFTFIPNSFSTFSGFTVTPAALRHMTFCLQFLNLCLLFRQWQRQRQACVARTWFAGFVMGSLRKRFSEQLRTAPPHLL